MMDVEEINLVVVASMEVLATQGIESYVFKLNTKITSYKKKTNLLKKVENYKASKSKNFEFVEFGPIIILFR